MLSVYYNKQAKRCLFAFLVFTFVQLLIALLISYHLHQQFQNTFIQRANELLSVIQTNGDLSRYLTDHYLDATAQTQFHHLQQRHIVPTHLSVSFSPTIISILLIWLILALCQFIVMTGCLHAIYKRIHRLQLFTSEVFTRSTLPDIRNNEEDEISSLENTLYTLATTIKTQLQTTQKQKDYLAKHIADISHQLKTPLTALLVVNDTLLSLPIAQRSDEQLQLLEPQLNKIEQLIQSLLVLTRLDAGALELKKVPLLAKDFLKQMVLEFSVLANEKHIALQTEWSNDATLLGDPFFLKESIGNIIKNAIEHTLPYHIISITIETSPFFNVIHLFNEGDPISQDDLPHIFKRFYKGEHAAPTSIGIGLSLAYEIIDLHGGKLTAQNVANGVLFSIHLPVLSH